jgi:hypothetical protein
MTGSRSESISGAMMLVAAHLQDELAKGFGTPLPQAGVRISASVVDDGEMNPGFSCDGRDHSL